MSESRAAVARYVRENPGSHFSAIADSLDMARGQVQYHLSRLSRSGDVEYASMYGRTHYYPRTYDERERATLALLRRETARGIVSLLLDEDGRRPAAVAEQLGVARSTVEHHLGHLTECDVVEKRRGDVGRVTLHLRRPDDVAPLLATVTSEPTDRLVDRFMCLVDDAFETE